MQTQLLPALTIAQVDRINRDFLWGDSEAKRRPHLVNWNMVCQTRDRGGLNIRDSRMVNEALLTKLGWRIVSGDRTPWCSALRALLRCSSCFRFFRSMD